MQDITFNGYHLPTIAQLAKELGSPINGAFAELIWHLSNRDTLPYTIAVEFMEEAGYVAFQGFPLVRR